VIVSLERQTIGVFTGPMCVREPERMLMRWIAIMDVQERSLGKGQQEAGDCAKMACPTHVLLSYRVVKVWALLTGADLRSRRCECAGQQQVTLSTQRPTLKCLEKEMTRMDQRRRRPGEAEAVFCRCPSSLKPACTKTEPKPHLIGCLEVTDRARADSPSC
jgi:hypothetical protein